MLIASRSGMAVRKQSYDSKVKYLESTGTQWIDTGVRFDSDIGFDIRFRPMKISNGHDFPMVIGIEDQNYEYYCGIWLDANLYTEVYYNNAEMNDSILYQGDVADTLDFHSSINFLGSGLLKMSPNTDGIEQTEIEIGPKNVNIGLFSSNTINGPMDFSSVRIYECKISRKNSVILDLIPVRIGTTGYMYDRISEQTLETLGTGNLILGQDIR